MITTNRMYKIGIVSGSVMFWRPPRGQKKRKKKKKKEEEEEKKKKKKKWEMYTNVGETYEVR